MNKARRKQLQALLDRFEELQAELEGLQTEEEESRDNIPENLWGSERYEKAEETCSYLEDAVGSLEEMVESLAAAIDA